MAPSPPFFEGECVWAKAEGFPWWPAKITAAIPDDLLDDQPDEYALYYLVEFIASSDGDDEPEFGFMMPGNLRRFGRAPDRRKDAEREVAVAKARSLMDAFSAAAAPRLLGLAVAARMAARLSVPMAISDRHLLELKRRVDGAPDGDEGAALAAFHRTPCAPADAVDFMAFAAAGPGGAAVCVHVGEFFVDRASGRAMRADRAYRDGSGEWVYGPAGELRGGAFACPKATAAWGFVGTIARARDAEALAAQPSVASDARLPPPPHVEAPDAAPRAVFASPLDIARASGLIVRGAHVRVPRAPELARDVKRKQTELWDRSRILREDPPFPGDTRKEMHELAQTALARFDAVQGCVFCGDKEDLCGPVVVRGRAGEKGSAALTLGFFHKACAQFTPDVYLADVKDDGAAVSAEKLDMAHEELCTQRRGGAQANAFARAVILDSSPMIAFSLEKAVRRARGIRCAVCRKPGASIGCWDTRCAKSFHYSCALRAGLRFGRRGDSRSLFCKEHSGK